LIDWRFFRKNILDFDKFVPREESMLVKLAVVAVVGLDVDS
jgi:hypothetical protein